MDKMIMAVIPHEQAEKVLNILINEGLTATFSETKGGMLRQSQYTLFIAVNNEEVDNVCEIIRDNCRETTQVDINTGDELEQNSISSFSTKVGGAVVFIWDIDKKITFE